MNNTDDLDYIQRRNELLKTMKRQSDLMMKGHDGCENSYNGKPRGRKSASSKRIVNYNVNSSRNKR
jgi:hypothetical protein